MLPRSDSRQGMCSATTLIYLEAAKKVGDYDGEYRRWPPGILGVNLNKYSCISLLKTPSSILYFSPSTPLTFSQIRQHPLQLRVAADLLDH